MWDRSFSQLALFDLNGTAGATQNKACGPLAWKYCPCFSVVYFCGKTPISSAPLPCLLSSLGLRIWYHHPFEFQVIQQVFSATESSRKRCNKYFIFHLLKNHVICKRVLAGLSLAWIKSGIPSWTSFDWFNLAFECRVAQRKPWASALHIWPTLTLRKRYRGFCLGLALSGYAGFDASLL